MTFKKILSFAASIISFIILLHSNISYSEESSSKYYSNDNGILSIMYHRFNENKYPSTNIQIDIFKKHLDLIQKSNHNFLNPVSLQEIFDKEKDKKTILLTIDDAYSSFYENAWLILKESKIPFILFVSTEAVGKRGYMNWDEIREIEKHDFVFIGNHSHSHDYLINFDYNEFEDDIKKSIRIFKKELGYNPIFFSYPFGEWSLKQKKYIGKNFKFAFGQHSGVIDLNKDKYELPRFPINEKYGDLKRFEFLIKLLPLQYKNIYPEEKIIDEQNPPKLEIEFFEDQKNINMINCFSNEGNGWEKSNIELNNSKMRLIFRDKFIQRRGRVNCSLNDNGEWRWFGIQFIVKSIAE